MSFFVVHRAACTADKPKYFILESFVEFHPKFNLHAKDITCLKQFKNCERILSFVQNYYELKKICRGVKLFYV